MGNTLKDQLKTWVTQQEQLLLFKARTRVNKVITELSQMEDDCVLVRARMSKDALRVLNPTYHVAWLVSRLHIMRLPTITINIEWFENTFGSLKDFEGSRFDYNDLAAGYAVEAIRGDPDLLVELMFGRRGAFMPRRVEQDGNIQMLVVPYDTQEVRSVTYGLDWELFDWRPGL